MIGVRGASIALLIALGGCAANDGMQVKQNLETVKQAQSWDHLFARGRAFAAVGDQTRAEQYLTGALDAGGDPKVILPVLLTVLIDGKRYRLAIDLIEDQLKTQPNATQLRFLVGTLHLAVGEPDLARKRLEEVLESTRPEPEAHYALGVLYRDNDNDLLRADMHFRAYIKLKPDGAHVQDARASLLKSVP